MKRISQGIDRLGVVFDDEGLVADGGLLLAATLMGRLGMEELVDDTLRLGDRVGGARPGRKVLTLVASMLAGGSHIDHADRLRAGSTDRVLGFGVMAPSTLGTFLRSLTADDVELLDDAAAEVLRRAWAAGAGPGDGPVAIDLDSTICAVSGKAKEGAAYGYTKVWGYHPLVASRAETGEMVGVRLREGASQQGNVEFATETIRRIRRAGATGPVTLRADSGFWSYDMFDTLEGLGVGWSITTPLRSNVRKAIAAIGEDAWTGIDYPQSGLAQIAETTIWVMHRTPPHRTDRASLGGAPQPLGRFRPDETVARLALPRLRYQPPPTSSRSRPTPPPKHRTPRHRTSDGRSRPIPPPPRRLRTCHPRPEELGGARPPTLRTLRRQRRLAGLRRLGPQPLPLDHTTRPDTARRQTHLRANHPHPPLRHPRPVGQPQPTAHPTTTRPMALGQRLPNHPRQPPRSPPILLTTPHILTTTKTD